MKEETSVKLPEEKEAHNPLAYLSPLGVVGILGVILRATIFIPYLLFFFFLAYAFMPPDELFLQNVRRAGLRALAVYLVLNTLAALGLVGNAIAHGWSSADVLITGVSVTLPLSQYVQCNLITCAFVLVFIATLCVFIFTLMYFNHREKKYTERAAADAEGTSC